MSIWLKIKINKKIKKIKMMKFISLFCFLLLSKIIYSQSNDSLNIALQKVAKKELRIIKTLKKVDIIKNDSFTQKSWLLKEMTESLQFASEKRQSAEVLNQAAVKKMALIKKLNQQKKPIGSLKQELDELIELTQNTLSSFNEAIKEVREKQELIPYADSTTIIKRKVTAKFIYEAIDETLMTDTYNIEFSRYFRIERAIKQYD